MRVLAIVLTSLLSSASLPCEPLGPQQILEATLRDLATNWAVGGASELRVDSVGARNSFPIRLDPDELDRLVEKRALAQTIAVGDPNVIHGFAQALAAQRWTVTDRTPGALDLRFRVTILLRDREALRLYIAADEDVLFRGSVLRGDSPGWLTRVWEIALAKEIYAP